ncbi:CHASE3 domain-containing protein [Thauera linaloolentis]|uniref:histidine kinase n=1 Tax=Thauera linaloolentis (strain DSM 12138 / JCM 21573 / CCUG 41526 / CIP 105981 / IAM 15112 / NBRC 102519 / 47Lol) TaxID=1123367 RepID=N6YW64_THAL4|nr:CHASE3 domain-containing protein [Thauera linaloolentis]ENO86358.1 histidine kinase [Thauera linaloolentis 47Lol = DSM 12138]MCM8565060.1 CHASE3 domain-containing protein [Thauera linaloolentis]
MPRPLSTLPRASTLLLLVVLALGFVLGVVWLLTAQRHAETSREALQQLQAQSSRVTHLDTLLVRLLDAESGVRGFILTGNPAYLAPYQDGSADIERTISALKAEDWPDAAQRDAVGQLATRVEARWASLAQAIEHSIAPEADGGRDGDGRQITDDIRSLIEDLRARTMEQIHATIVASFDHLGDARRTNTVLGMGVLVLLATIIVLLYRQDRLSDRLAALLRSENERLQSVVEARTAELSSLASYLTNTREAEQERIARELHDELGSLLTAAKLDAGWIARKLPAEAVAPLRERFDRLLDTLSQIISIKRRVVADLRPPLLSDLGLAEALRSLAQSGVVGEDEGRIELELPDTLPELPATVSLALYRIAQEALTNVRRHARATHVRLSLASDQGRIVLRVEDNGDGFDPSARRHQRHGLTGIAHRVQMLAGKLDIDSRPGHGTRIVASIPITA